MMTSLNRSSNSLVHGSAFPYNKTIKGYVPSVKLCYGAQQLCVCDCAWYAHHTNNAYSLACVKSHHIISCARTRISESASNSCFQNNVNVAFPVLDITIILSQLLNCTSWNISMILLSHTSNQSITTYWSHGIR